MWGSWQDGTCSDTCGAGSQTDTRMCNNPAKVGSGLACVGSAARTVSCDLGIVSLLLCFLHSICCASPKQKWVTSTSTTVQTLCLIRLFQGVALFYSTRVMIIKSCSCIY